MNMYDAALRAAAAECDALKARLAEAERLLLKFHTGGPSAIAMLIDEVPAFLGIWPMPNPDETGICPTCGEGISAHYEGECKRAADSATGAQE